MIKSIVQEDMSKCYICGKTFGLEIHHVMSGNANRKLSTRWGLVVALCRDHHQGPLGAHQDIIMKERLEKDAQRAFESRYGHGAWMNTFRKNYL